MVRMDAQRLQKQLLFSQLSAGSQELVLLKRDTRTHLKGPLKTLRMLTEPQSQQTDWYGGERFVMALRLVKPIGE